MNNTFSMHRVVLLARKHYVDSARSYLFGILVLGALSALGLYFMPSFGAPILVMFLIFGSVYFTQVACRSHYDRRSIEQSYTLPATQFEKYLFIWFNSAIVSTIVMTGLILFISFLYTVIQQESIGLTLSEMYYPVWITYFIIQSSVLFSCCWVKDSPIKGYLIIIGLLIACVVLYSLAWHLAPDANYNISIFETMCAVYSDTAVVTYRLLENTPEYLNTTVIGLIIPVLWVAAYFKFKERTVK